MRVALLLWPALLLAADVEIAKRYLHLPVARGGDLRNVQIRSGSEIVHYFRIALPKDKSDPLYWTSIDVGAFRNRTLSVVALPPGPEIDPAVLCEQSDTVRQPANLYREPYRPQFHFTAATGWINDPNGLVYYDGDYQLFYQHDPYGPGGANKSWGRAASRDLVHWTDYGDVLLPDRLGAIYSGSAVIDHRNTSGFQTGSTPPMVVFYTSAGGHAPDKPPFTQSLAYSNDRGRTWTKYPGNPIIGHIEGTNRDPKVFWHEPSRKWVMALYLERGKFVILGSSNLREWTKQSDLAFPDGYECPELFEMPVDGNRANTRWIFWEAGGRHLIGRFDGTTFTAESGVLPSEWGSNSYAGQTWNDAPQGRRLFISWMAASGKRVPEPIYPGMPFNQQMSFPREFTLRTTPDGLRLFAQPVREIEKLYARQHRMRNVKLAPGANPLARFNGELFDIQADLELRDATAITLDIRGTPITLSGNGLACLGRSAEFKPAGGRLDLRVLVDRTSIEIFAAGGRYVMSFCFKPDPANRRLSLAAEGGTAAARSLIVRELIRDSIPAQGSTTGVLTSW